MPPNVAEFVVHALPGEYPVPSDTANCDAASVALPTVAALGTDNRPVPFVDSFKPIFASLPCAEIVGAAPVAAPVTRAKLTDVVVPPMSV